MYGTSGSGHIDPYAAMVVITSSVSTTTATNANFISVTDTATECNRVTHAVLSVAARRARRALLRCGQPVRAHISAPSPSTTPIRCARAFARSPWPTLLRRFRGDI